MGEKKAGNKVANIASFLVCVFGLMRVFLFMLLLWSLFFWSDSSDIQYTVKTMKKMKKVVHIKKKWEGEKQRKCVSQGGVEFLSTFVLWFDQNNIHAFLTSR